MPEARPSGARLSADCPFCGISDGRLPAHIVAESPDLLAFLDIHPIRPGHVQIIPRLHLPYFNDLPPELGAEILHLGQRLANVQREIYGVSRVGFLFTGGDVPHAHAHVVPLVSATDITSRRYIAEQKVTFRDLPRPPDRELATTAWRLRRGLATAQDIGAMP